MQISVTKRQYMAVLLNIRSNIYQENRDQLKSLQALINKTNANYRSTKKQTYYDNYLDGSLLNLGYYVGYDEEKLRYIREQLGELTPDQFIKAFNEEASLKDMQDRYAIMHEEGVSPDKLSEEVTPLLDELYNNIDKIVATYK